MVVHEKGHDAPAVSEIGSAKLNALSRCSAGDQGHEDPMQLY